MAKHVFLAAGVEDKRHVEQFRREATKVVFDLSLWDHLVRDAYNSGESGLIRARITERLKLCSTVVCLIGAKTAESRWVDWEVRRASELGLRVLGVRLPDLEGDIEDPQALADIGAPIVEWDVEAVARSL